jgi:hypothetical protein
MAASGRRVQVCTDLVGRPPPTSPINFKEFATMYADKQPME